MILDTLYEVEHTLARFQNPVVAYSGGKDGFVAAHICNRVRPGILMMCETSFYFKKQIANIKSIAERHRFNVVFTDTLRDDFLLRHPEIIFARDKKIRAFSFHQRQHRAVKNFARDHGCDASIFGRRTEENTVPKKLYTTKAGVQYHPLREWKLQDIWEYFKIIGEEKPFIYSTRFGINAGNAAFYSLKPKGMTLQQCWDIVNEVDGDTELFDKFGNVTKQVWQAQR